MLLVYQATASHNPPVPFNNGPGLATGYKKADSRLAAIFTSVCNTIGASFSMAGRGGDTFGYAGSFLPVRQPHHVPATPRLATRARASQLKKEATMPSIALRAIRALFPVFSVPVSTVPTHAQAYAMARLLVSQGKRVAIAPAAQGFTVSEVKA